MFEVNAIITMKFSMRESDSDWYRERVSKQISDLETIEKVLSKSDEYGSWVVITIKKPLMFDSFRDFIFDVEQTIKEYEDSLAGATIKKVVFEDFSLSLNPYV
jgi:hypothetical protein